jgi:hypothetical protein
MIGIDMTLDDVIAHHQIARLLAEFARAMDERDWNRIAEILVKAGSTAAPPLSLLCAAISIHADQRSIFLGI